MLIYRFRKSDRVFDQVVEVPDDTKSIPQYHTFQAPPEQPGYYPVMANGWELRAGEKPSDPDLDPERIKALFNVGQKQQRAQAYRDVADPVFFKAQRGEATLEEWQNLVEEIKTQYPYEA